MQAIILAGGYAKRLRPLTTNRPKPLLPIDGRPILQHILQKLKELDEVDHTILSTNLKFAPRFKEWLENNGYSNVEIVTDNSNSEKEKPGATAALAHITSEISEDCLIIAGDNLFTTSLQEMKQRFRKINQPLIAVYDVKNIDEAKRYATASLDKEGRIVKLIEKPPNPETTLAAVCIYMLPKRTLPLIREYVDKQTEKDAPGRFIEWLYKKEPVYAYRLKGRWWDIGTPQSYREARDFFKRSSSHQSRRKPPSLGGGGIRLNIDSFYQYRMLQTLVVRLETREEKATLLETMERFNLACNYAASKGAYTSKYELQKVVYRELREKYGLGAQMSIRVISKVVEAYKRDVSKVPEFRQRGSIQYDQRNLSWKGLDRVSISTIKGRMTLKTRIGDYQKQHLHSKVVRGQADLIYRNDSFYLAVVVDAPEKTPYEPKDILGVDLGIVNIATDSTGEHFSGKKVDETRERYASLRARLQAKGTKSAKRHLKRLSGRERRFKQDVNHTVSKTLVGKAERTESLITLENLSGSRGRARV
ncbi:MAG: sugar phosphate nucleotidyltransferase, partial [Candidatus Bathyarchaeia archaeon]